MKFTLLVLLFWLTATVAIGQSHWNGRDWWCAPSDASLFHYENYACWMEFEACVMLTADRHPRLALVEPEQRIYPTFATVSILPTPEQMDMSEAYKLGYEAGIANGFRKGTCFALRELQPLFKTLHVKQSREGCTDEEWNFKPEMLSPQ